MANTDTHGTSLLRRRRFLFALGGAAVLSGCGGGSGGSGGPGRGFTVLPTAFTASQHSATLAADGTVILVGGSRGQGTLSDAIDRFDPRTQALVRIGSLAAGRSAHCASRLADGTVLVTGGLLSSGDTRLVERIDEKTGASSANGLMSVSRVYHAAVVLADGRVLVAGGNSSGERAALGISDSAEIWDAGSQRFRRLAAHMGTARAGHTLTLLADGRVLVAGGYSATPAYQFAEIFDPRDESFTPVADTLPLRAGHVAHAQGDGRVLVLGGETTGSGNEIIPLASVLRFDPVAGRFSELPPLAAPRSLAASVLPPDGKVLLFGGQQALPRYTATCESYDPATGGSFVASLDGERALHTATRLQDGRVLVAGGETSSGPYTTSMLAYG